MNLQKLNEKRPFLIDFSVENNGLLIAVYSKKIIPRDYGRAFGAFLRLFFQKIICLEILKN